MAISEILELQRTGRHALDGLKNSPWGAGANCFTLLRCHYLIILIIFIIVVIIIELTHSKTILEVTVEIESQPAALDFKNLPQYSSRSK